MGAGGGAAAPPSGRAYQEELRATNAALDNALAALRPVGQRFALALGATAPEPQERGLGMQKVAELKEGAAGRAGVVLSQLLAERDVGSTPAGPLRDVLSSAASLVLQLQACGLSHLRRRVSAATRCSPRSTSSRPPPRPTSCASSKC